MQSVVEPTPAPTQDLELGEMLIREKIVHALRIYPKLSMSMLQVAIGTGLNPQLWHPVLNKLLREGIVVRERITKRTPRDRDQTYNLITLNTAKAA